jgi:hypothetical protein
LILLSGIFCRSRLRPTVSFSNMATKRAISEIAGRADFGGPASGVVYRALCSLRCAACDRVIDEGELFTRRPVFKKGMPILPKCRKCVPFTLRAEGEAVGHPMLDSILSPATETSPAPEKTVTKTSGGTQDQENRKKIADAVLERLGPALRHSRTKAAFTRKRG